jgi:hypothetical protein
VLTDGVQRLDDTEWVNMAAQAEDVSWMKPVLDAD